MIGFCPLASGSKGNAIFFGTKTTRILIDVGIGLGPLTKRLAEIGVSLDTIQAVLVTHEHNDHIQGAWALWQRWRIPLFSNAETAKGTCTALGERPKFKIFATNEPFSFGDLEIHPFSVPHDTRDPVAFSIQTRDLKMAFCTDLGHAPLLVKKQLEGCDYLYLEANHQVSMVHACARPAIYKQRVLSKQGHLSNEQCASLLNSLLHPKLKHVHLAHLSSECNAEEVALQVVRQGLGEKGRELPLSIAYQERLSKAILF